MVEHADGFSLYHFLETTVPTVVTIVLFMLAGLHKAKKDLDQRHAENQKTLDALVVQNKYLPAHLHQEKNGPLTAENIRYDPGLEIT